MSFFIENLMAPLRVTVGDIAIMIPVDLNQRLIAPRCGRLRTRLSVQGTAHSQLHCQDRVVVSVRDAVAASIECPYIILCSSSASKVSRRWRPSRHLRRLVGVQRLFFGRCWLCVFWLCTYESRRWGRFLV